MPDEAALQRLLDQQSIIDALHRYARGADRGDFEMMASLYHEEALDDHGYFVGKGTDLVQWSAGFRKSNPHVTVVRHALSNHSFDFSGPDTAHVETYYTTDTIIDGEKPVLRTTIGRYADRFERRSGEWRVAARVCTIEATGQCDYLPLEAGANFAVGRRDRSDVSYQRPLTVTRELTESAAEPTF